jgi:hypothetical protein
MRTAFLDVLRPMRAGGCFVCPALAWSSGYSDTEFFRGLEVESLELRSR